MAEVKPGSPSKGPKDPLDRASKVKDVVTAALKGLDERELASLAKIRAKVYDGLTPEQRGIADSTGYVIW